MGLEWDAYHLYTTYQLMQDFFHPPHGDSSFWPIILGGSSHESQILVGH